MESVMRPIFKLSMFCLAVGIGTGCKPEEIIITEDIPTAGVRFVHAVPDAAAMDFRPVDIVENTHFFAVTFRSTSLFYYKNARAGARNFRIFKSSTDQSVASQVIEDVNVTLEAGKNYTFILWGRESGSPAMQLSILNDDPADPGSQVALRLVNATGSAIDGRQYPNGGTAPGTPTWAAVPALSASAYVTAPTGQIRYNVTPAGGGTALFADALALAGTAATVDLDATPGTTIAGSAVSGFIFPASVAGSPATSFAAPGVIFVWDRRPPRPPGV
jgi:hypothetical protein